MGAPGGEATKEFELLPQRVRHVPTGIVLIRVPPGSFVMGSPPEEKQRDADEEQHEVVFDAPFWLAETEVSVGLWNEVMDIDPWDPVRTDLPASDVSWHEAQEFLRRLNEREGGGWRLPTEAEWEYACRAGTTTPFSFGADVFPSQANYDDRYPYAHERGSISPGTVPVGSLPANPWGFHEMHGNVKEWCQDVYRFRHADPPVTAADLGASRVLPVGDWVSGDY